MVEDRGVREWVSRYMVREMANAASGESHRYPEDAQHQVPVGLSSGEPHPGGRADQGERDRGGHAAPVEHK